MRGFIDQQYGQRWGAFAAGALIAAIPVDAAVPRAAEVHRRRPHAGRSQGMSGTRIADRARRRGGRAARAAASRRLGRVRARAAARSRRRGGAAAAGSARVRGRPRAVALRARRRAARGRGGARRRDRDGDVVARVVPGPQSEHAVPVAARPRRERLLVGDRPRRRRRSDLPDGGDFVLTLDAGGPDWHLRSVVYEIFPDRFASTGAGADAPLPEWAVRREWDARPEGRSRNTPRELFGGDLPGIEQRLDHVEQLGANALYLTPVFPAGSTHRYDATTFDRVDPLLGGDAALASLVAAAHVRGIRVIGDLTLNHCGAGHDWFIKATRGRQLAGARLLLLRRLVPPRLRLVVRREVAAEARPPQPRAAAALRRRPRVRSPAGGCGRPHGFDGWRIDVANMSGRHHDVDLTLELARAMRATLAGCARRRGARRRARPRLPRRPPGLRLARDDELRRLPAPRVGVASRRRAAGGAAPLRSGVSRSGCRTRAAATRPR